VKREPLLRIREKVYRANFDVNLQSS
jgi:hypothetical protein